MNLDLSDPQVKRNFARHFIYRTPKSKKVEYSVNLSALFLGLIIYAFWKLKLKFSRRKIRRFLNGKISLY